MLAYINGARLYFDVLNDGLQVHKNKVISKTPCFVMHGGPGMDHTGVKDCVQGLKDIFQLVLPDERGSGRSEHVPLRKISLANMAHDIEGLKNHLGFEKIALMGISYGGMLALDYASRYPHSLSALMLICTTPGYAGMAEVRATVGKIKDTKMRACARRAIDGNIRSNNDLKNILTILQPLYSIRPDIPACRRAVRNVNSNYRVINWWFKDKYRVYNLVPRLSGIRVPTLIVGGTKDWICPVSQSMLMHRLIPHSRLVIFRQGHHSLFNDENEKFTRVIKSFWKAARTNKHFQ